MTRPRMLLFLLLAALSENLSDCAMPWLGGDSPPLVALALAASASQGPDLGVSILRSGADPRPLAAPGQAITISVGVNNLRGGGDAHSSVLTVKLPSALALQSASPSPDRTEGGSSLVWNLGTMEAGAFPRLFELNLTVAGNASSGVQLTLSADVATSDREENLKNNTVSLTVFVQSAAADLNVLSNLDAVPLTIGGPVKFTAEVSNLGTIVATASALTVVLPKGVSFKAGDPAPGTTSGDTVTWQLGDIEPGASRVVTVTIALDPRLTPREFEAKPSPASLLKFRFDASTTATEANPADNHLEITKPVERAGSDLKVWLSVSGADEPGELPVGKDVTYMITYGNFGNQPASHASVSLSLWKGLNLVRAEPAPVGSSKSDRFGGGVLSWNPGDLRPGQSSVIKCLIHVASVPEYGSLVMATISAPGSEINSSNNVAYAYWHAPRVAARSHRMLYWVLFVAVLAVLWAVWRARRRRSALGQSGRTVRS